MMDQFDPASFATSSEPANERLKGPCDRMMDEILLTLKLERAVILVRPGEKWQIASAHEVPTKDFWNLAPISLSIVQSAVEKKEPLCLMDAGTSSQFGGKDSVIIAGIRSVACAPYLNQNGEARLVVYADSRIDKGAFTPDDVETLSELAVELGRRLESLL